MSSLDRIIDLQRLMFAFNNLERTLLVPGAPGKPARDETDTGHSYSLAMAAWYLAQNLPHLDTDKCIRYALVHDLIEIHSGDTFMYDKDQSRHDSKDERERQAAITLGKDWPDFDEMTAAIQDYEARANPESRFVYALDKLMPMVVNHITGGKNYRRHGIKLDDVKQAKSKKVAVSPEIKELYDELIAVFESKPAYFG